MPTYDYVCKSCGHEWELFQTMKSNPVRKCPECGKLKASRVIGPGAGIIFKGSGFYQTDYRSDSYKKGADAAKKATEKSSKTETDSKPTSDSKKSTTTSTEKSSSSSETKKDS